MKKLNQSQFALLGLLSLGPRSGYDLKQLSEWSVGHFWREGYGQIYPSLKRLAAAGLVKRSTERNKGRPERMVYTLTARGRKEMAAWLQKSAAAEIPRNELLMKVFFGGMEDTRTGAKNVRKHIADKMAQCERDMEELKETQRRIEREAARHPQKPFWLMTLRYGEHMIRARIAWCGETTKKLNQIKKTR